MTSLRSACSPTFSLRRRMLHFIQNLVYYLKFDVIEPAWRELESKLAATKEYCRSGRAKVTTKRTRTPDTPTPANHSPARSTTWCTNTINS